MRPNPILLVFLAAPLLAASAAHTAAPAADPVRANIEIDSGAHPGTMSFIWSLQGPYAMPMFSIDPRKVRVSYRKVGALMPIRAVPKNTRPFSASRVSMTNFDALQAFVQFADVAVPAGTYAIRGDARDALTWTGAAGSVELVTPPAYVYVSGVDTVHQPDAEIKALGKAFASHDAVVRIPFVVKCAGVGIETIAADTRLDVIGFTRGASEQIGNGPNGVHAARSTGPNGVGDTANAFTALTAVDAAFSHLKIEGKPDCEDGSAGFASSADVHRYLSPVPAL